MNGVIKNISFYAHPADVGYIACIDTAVGQYFVKETGLIVGPYVDGELKDIKG